MVRQLGVGEYGLREMGPKNHVDRILEGILKIRVIRTETTLVLNSC